MKRGRIKAARLKRKLTQKQLADLVGTSQQQIQRIEAEVQTARFDLAIALAKVLEVPLEQLFPSAKTALNALSKKTAIEALNDDELQEKFEAAGIDLDPHQWILKYHLRNGISGFFRVPGNEKKRVWSLVQDTPSHTSFIVFDSLTERIAINRKHLLFSHFLFEPPIAVMTEKRTTESLVVYISSSATPIELDIDPDEHDVSAEEEPDEQTQLHNLFFTLESICEDDEVVSVTDQDGETAFFRAADIALLKVPLWIAEPRLFENQMDAMDEPDATDKESDQEE